MPATHVPVPVHPWPPHWDHLGNVPAAAEELVAGAEVVEVDNVVAVPVLVAPALEELLMTTPPGPATEVVSEPLSMYTPLK